MENCINAQQQNWFSVLSHMTNWFIIIAADRWRRIRSVGLDKCRWSRILQTYEKKTAVKQPFLSGGWRAGFREKRGMYRITNKTLTIKWHHQVVWKKRLLCLDCWVQHWCLLGRVWLSFTWSLILSKIVQKQKWKFGVSDGSNKTSLY